MKFLRAHLDKVGELFHGDGKLKTLYPLYEANDTFLFTPGEVTQSASHVRDAIDLKRMMSIVVVALIPCICMAIYNTGYQANLVVEQVGVENVQGWRLTLLTQHLGQAADSTSRLSCCLHGLLWYLPVVIVTLVVGGNLEALFSIVRKHEINEGFLVTWCLFPLVLPPSIPLWQVALGIAFGVVVGKEVFGGTGMNVLNPALTARAFLFFAYPAEITGDQVWYGVPAETWQAAQANGLSAPTLLSEAATGGMAAIHSAAGGWSWTDCFFGFTPGSMGETSTLACLFGALVLVVTRVGSLRIMVGCVVGTIAAACLLNAIGSETNPFFDVPFYWHLVVGGWAFGVVFMATEPVTAPYAESAKFWYGLSIGVLIVLIRVVNPAYPEGVMLAILLMNCFAASFDHVVMSRHIERRKARTAPDASSATEEPAHA